MQPAQPARVESVTRAPAVKVPKMWERPAGGVDLGDPCTLFSAIAISLVPCELLLQEDGNSLILIEP